VKVFILKEAIFTSNRKLPRGCTGQEKKESIQLNLGNCPFTGEVEKELNQHLKKIPGGIWGAQDELKNGRSFFVKSRFKGGENHLSTEDEPTISY